MKSPGYIHFESTEVFSGVCVIMMELQKWLQSELCLESIATLHGNPAELALGHQPPNHHLKTKEVRSSTSSLQTMYSIGRKVSSVLKRWSLQLSILQRFGDYYIWQSTTIFHNWRRTILFKTRNLGALWAPTSSLWPFGLALSPSGLLDFVLRALRPCDPRSCVHDAIMAWWLGCSSKR